MHKITIHQPKLEEIQRQIDSIPDDCSELMLTTTGKHKYWCALAAIELAAVGFEVDKLVTHDMITFKRNINF
ncbi:TPA: hypothetical protein ACGU4W_001094 [Vibrio vulnificus]|nr:hypothetical protein [Vibrio vulnificus]